EFTEKTHGRFMSELGKDSVFKEENNFLFGVKWSFAGFAVALSFLAGCSLFSEDIPRYNTVTGGKRVPMLNPGGRGHQPPAMPPPSEQMAPEPMPPKAMVYQAPPAPQPAPVRTSAPAAAPVEEKAWYESVGDWFSSSDKKPDDGLGTTRHLPSEN